MADLFLYEFLFRGRHPGDDNPAAYHVILGYQADDEFGGRSIVLSPAMTPQQAKEKGFDLPQIVSEIDTAMATEISALQEKVDAAAAENERLAAQNNALQADLKAASDAAASLEKPANAEAPAFSEDPAAAQPSAGG